MKKNQIKRLVELANDLDEKGMSKVADEIDKVVKGQERYITEGSPKDVLEQVVKLLGEVEGKIKEVPEIFDDIREEVGEPVATFLTRFGGSLSACFTLVREAREGISKVANTYFE